MEKKVTRDVKTMSTFLGAGYTFLASLWCQRSGGRGLLENAFWLLHQVFFLQVTCDGGFNQAYESMIFRKNVLRAASPHMKVRITLIFWVVPNSQL